MKKDKNQPPNDANEKSKHDIKSSVDLKNESIKRDTPSATERVKPRAGDGLANEGTIVSYEEER